MISAPTGNVDGGGGVCARRPRAWWAHPKPAWPQPHTGEGGGGRGRSPFLTFKSESFPLQACISFLIKTFFTADFFFIPTRYREENRHRPPPSSVRFHFSERMLFFLLLTLVTSPRTNYY